MSPSLPLVAVADLHGHLQHLHTLIAWLDDRLGDYVLVPLGDYCDNGPDVPGLLDHLIELCEQRGDRMRPIVGNHDLACLRALNDDRWYCRWSRRYWGYEGGTPYQHGARDAESFRACFPASHRAFLDGLPWFAELDGYVFVHSGLEMGPITPQLEPLARKELPAVLHHLPPPIREKALSEVSDPSWDRVVVSAHNAGLTEPLFATPKRLCLRAGVDRWGELHAVILPERRLLAICPNLRIEEKTGPTNK